MTQLARLQTLSWLSSGTTTVFTSATAMPGLRLSPCCPPTQSLRHAGTPWSPTTRLSQEIALSSSQRLTSALLCLAEHNKSDGEIGIDFIEEGMKKILSTRHEIFQTELAEGFYAIQEGNTSVKLAPQKGLAHKDEAKLAAMDNMVTAVSRTVDSTSLWSQEYEDLSKMGREESLQKT